jgi:hypothetical protein
MAKLTPEQMGKVLEDLAEEAELERFDDMTSEQIEAEARAAGVDIEKTRAAAARILEEAENKRAARAKEAPAPATQKPEVVRLEDRKKARSPFPRWGTVLAIAAAFVLGFGIARQTGLFEPPDVVGHANDDPRAVARASALRLQDEAKQDALHLRWRTCLEKLDQAKALFPALDRDPEVQDLRSAALAELADAGATEAGADAR